MGGIKEMNKYYESNENDMKLIVMIICIIVVLIVCICRPIDKVSDMREVAVTVTDKAVKNSGDDGKYLIFTEDAKGNIEVFEITDSLLKGRYNSSDIYAAIKVNETYIFTVGGSRNEFLSWYPNIYDYTLIETTTKTVE